MVKIQEQTRLFHGLILVAWGQGRTPTAHPLCVRRGMTSLALSASRAIKSLSILIENLGFRSLPVQVLDLSSSR
jgi:hypothetical protein